MKVKINPLTAIDFYKADHRRQYPEGTTLVYSNLTPRSDHLANKSSVYDGKIVVHRDGMGNYMYEDCCVSIDEGFLILIFKDGKLLHEHSLTQTRKRVGHI